VGNDAIQEMGQSLSRKSANVALAFRASEMCQTGARGSATDIAPALACLRMGMSGSAVIASALRTHLMNRVGFIRQQKLPVAPQLSWIRVHFWILIDYWNNTTG